MTASSQRPLLRTVQGDEITSALRPPVDASTLAAAQKIVERVQTEGLAALVALAIEFAERTSEQPIVLERDAMDAALAKLPGESQDALLRAADRIRAFAQAQRDAIHPTNVPIPGGRAGHTVEPVAAAGCYAPAGRYPLPSSVLMTAVTARIAGCERVVVASPGAHPVALAAAAIAGADTFLCVGGAHAIAAMAYGFEGFDRCDVVVGPGNKWVTAAKQLVSGIVGIDMLAGPSELLVIADDSADPAAVAADLLAQAEHDADAVPMLLTTSRTLADNVQRELANQLVSLSTRDTAQAALANGFVCQTDSLDEARVVADTIAAEHVELLLADPAPFARSLRNAGALFIGHATAEVLGDYGAGPNHTLPTGGTARFQAGLSVMHFLRLRTWLHVDDAKAAQPIVHDALHLATLEGLAGHARSAAARLMS